MAANKELKMSRLEFTILRITTCTCARIARLQAAKLYGPIFEVTDCPWLLHNVATLNELVRNAYDDSIGASDEIIKRVFQYLDGKWKSNKW